ncbi:hypothetical protein EAE_22380 [Klebsiella aerogenes KCTC 2190]|uniref:Uncharacterized protein n=1 Tax=Klebsiella aerogenes (strain ATCC 13048 / DSM 30053 / CCUG 1429 / JCM 1235 / KCTC 2190 / NBRC 13534 / NCIMB 10102 / NCTC 10006 / CDC 819-56) TaxID=1028307 RepID=A0A0H3FU93_KLEAK|nr:hypothetical protein EAE_22380 [Klebsiella aerogenes KCTC 2190]
MLCYWRQVGALNAFGLVSQEVGVVHAASSSVMVSSSLPPLTIGILFTL